MLDAPTPLPRNKQASDTLAPEFRFLWQYNGELNRDQYLTAGKGPYATLRNAFPDLFWNGYDYRVRRVLPSQRKRFFRALVWCSVTSTSWN